MDARYLNKILLIAAAAMVFGIGSVFAQSANTSIGYVKTAKGTSAVIRDGNRSTARSGEALFEKDVLETGDDGSLGVTLKDNTLLSLGPNTSLILETYLLRPDRDKFSLITQISRGTVQYVSGLIAKLSPDSVQIRTPSATLGVRGTRLLIKVADDAN